MTWNKTELTKDQVEHTVINFYGTEWFLFNDGYNSP